MGFISTLKNTAIVASFFSAISGVRFLASTLYATYENSMDTPTAEEMDILHSADSGDFDRLRYFFMTHKELWVRKSRSVGLTLCINGHLSCLKYWHHKGGDLDTIHDAALRTKHIYCFKYYIANSTKITVYDIYNVICFGNLDHLRYLIEICRFPILGMDMHIEYSLAVRLNSHHILDYLHELGFREICGTIVCVPTKECMYLYPTQDEQSLMPTLRFLDTIYWDGQKLNGSCITGGSCSYEEYPKPSYILSQKELEYNNNTIRTRTHALDPPNRECDKIEVVFSPESGSIIPPEI